MINITDTEDTRLYASAQEIVDYIANVVPSGSGITPKFYEISAAGTQSYDLSETNNVAFVFVRASAYFSGDFTLVFQNKKPNIPISVDVVLSSQYGSSNPVTIKLSYVADNLAATTYSYSVPGYGTTRQLRTTSNNIGTNIVVSAVKDETQFAMISGDQTINGTKTISNHLVTPSNTVLGSSPTRYATEASVSNAITQSPVGRYQSTAQGSYQNYRKLAKFSLSTLTPIETTIAYDLRVEYRRGSSTIYYGTKGYMIITNQEYHYSWGQDPEEIWLSWNYNRTTKLAGNILQSNLSSIVLSDFNNMNWNNHPSLIIAVAKWPDGADMSLESDLTKIDIILYACNFNNMSSDSNWTCLEVNNLIIVPQIDIGSKIEYFINDTTSINESQMLSRVLTDPSSYIVNDPTKLLYQSEPYASVYGMT